VDGQGYPIVRVVFRDHFYEEDEKTAEELQADCLIEVTGYLIRNTPDLISVSPCKEEAGYWTRTQSIWRAMVVEGPIVLEAVSGSGA
jgi:hypothetical protein